MRKSKLFPILIIIAVFSLLAGCAPKANPTTGSTIKPTENTGSTAPLSPKIGGKLVATLDNADPTTLNPFLAVENVGIWTGLELYDQYFRLSQDGKSIENDAVESYEISSDNLIYTFHFRKNLTFSDGTPVTMDDILFSSQQMLSSPAWGFLFPTDISVKSLDNYTIMYTFTSPNAPFINNLALWVSSIVPKKLIETQGDAFWQNPIGSGPFMLKDWKHGEHITIVRNPYYWDQPKPYLDEIVFEQLQDDNTRILKFQAHELDVAQPIPYSQLTTIDSIEGAHSKISQFWATNIVFINTAVKPLDDVNVRMALNYAIDRQAIIDTVLFGHGDVATTIWPKGLLYWDNDLKGYPFDLDTAKQYMAKSSVPQGFDLHFTTVAGRAQDNQVATLLKDQWAKIGVNLIIEPTDGTLANDKMNTGDYAIYMSYWSNDVLDPSEYNYLVLCGHTQTSAGICDQSIDSLAADADKMTDSSQREAAYHKLFQMANDLAIYAPLYYYPTTFAVWDYVQNINPTPTGNVRYWEVWLNK
jgi:peptide/nickel transport system substrate-binding protein